MSVPSGKEIKSEIPLVVASERGEAQTVRMQACRRCTYRVVGPLPASAEADMETVGIVERPGKAGHRG